MFINRLLQVVVVLVYLYSLQMVLCQGVAEVLKEGGVNHLFNSKEFSSNVIGQEFKLYHVCSGKHLEIHGKSVRAAYDENNLYVKMSMESHQEGKQVAITIRGIESRRYLCFNKKGKLVTKAKLKRKRCMFKETINAGLIQFKALRSPWYVGFTDKGKPLNGTNSVNRSNECYSFMKRDPSHFKQPDIGPKPGPILSEEEYSKIINGEKKRNRRRRRRTTKIQLLRRPTEQIFQEINVKSVTTVQPIR